MILNFSDDSTNSFAFPAGYLGKGRLLSRFLPMAGELLRSTNSRPVGTVCCPSLAAKSRKQFRKDLGVKGSFGGKANSLDRLIRQPVVFVHGVSDTAGDKMRQAADQYKSVPAIVFFDQRIQRKGLP